MNEIQHEAKASKGSFFIEEEGTRLAEMTYSDAGAILIIDHTDVSDRLRGTGTGKKLVESAVTYARTHGKKIMPLCPFARSVFDRTPEWGDILL